jgi:hypothetical protein
MTTPLDETLRSLRREAMREICIAHDTVFAHDIERTLATDNLEKLKTILESKAAYLNHSDKCEVDSITFSVGIRLIETISFAEAYQHAAISVSPGTSSFPLKNLKANCQDFTAFYASHPLVKGVITRIQDFCGPSTRAVGLGMRMMEDIPTVSIKFEIPMVVDA